MSDTLFSIIVTSYNQREFIRDAVDSALWLRGGNKEIIVVDDGSTDGSQPVLRAYGDAIRLVALQTNLGKGGARNAVASMATGDYLVFLDGDDAFLPWALEVYERIVQVKKPRLILGCKESFTGALSAAWPVDDPHEIQIVEYDDYMRKDRTFGPSASALVIDRRSFLRVQGWAEEPRVMGDLDMLFKLGNAGRTVQILSPPTFLYRVHAGQVTKQVPLFIDTLYKLISKENMGRYPGGQRRLFERLASFGGHVAFWMKRAFNAGLYFDAIKLFARAWPMILAAVALRLWRTIRGRRPVELISM